MRIGTRADYGLRALIELADRYQSGAKAHVREIAERQAIPKDYLALIMIDLRKAGLVESVRGPGGGYRLAHPPEEISMGQAIRVLEGPINLIDCATDLGFDACSVSLRCRMRNVWIEAGRAVMAILDATTLADLCSPRRATQELPNDNHTTDQELPRGLTFHI